MVKAEDLRRGQTVRVTYDSEHRTDRDAKIVKVPPFTHTICGEEIEVTDKAQVQYPGTSIDGGGLFADMAENIPLEDIHLK